MRELMQQQDKEPVQKPNPDCTSPVLATTHSLQPRRVFFDTPRFPARCLANKQKPFVSETQVSGQALRIVTKIVRDQSGVDFLACFAVTNINGELCFRLMSLRPAKAKVGKTETFLLTDELSIPSPYVSKTIRVETREPAYKELSFVLSQPTRAPNTL